MTQTQVCSSSSILVGYVMHIYIASSRSEILGNKEMYKELKYPNIAVVCLHPKIKQAQHVLRISQ